MRKEPYGYDAVDQIIGVQYITNNVITRTVNYEYDPVGNRQQVTENGIPTGYTANNLNQYTVVDGATLSYDANGNLASVSGPPPLGNATAQYDAQNRLVSASGGPSSVTATFAYDARNRCVARTLNGVTTYLIYDGWCLIEERDTTGAQTAKYIHGATTDEILMRVSGGAIHYYHHDGLGSTIALTDSTGAIVESYHYDVFGTPSVFDSSFIHLPSSLAGNRFLFTGREYLADLSLYDYRNRFYAPLLGRFLQTDPIRFGRNDANLYRYCGNNPMNWIDALGLRWLLGGPSTTTLNTVVTDGQGGVTTRFSPLNDPNMPEWQKEVIQAHEQSHIDDIMEQNPDIAQAEPPDLQIVNDDPLELWESEVKAWQDTESRYRNVLGDTNPNLTLADKERALKGLEQAQRTLREYQRMIRRKKRQ